MLDLKGKKITDLVLISDVDGTLFNSAYGVPQRNIDAINRFTSKGGRFTLASGRAHFAMHEITKLFKINAPGITCNGCVIFDFEKENIHWAAMLPDIAKDIVRQVYKSFVNTSIVLITTDGMQVLRHNKYCQKLMDDENVPFEILEQDKAQQQWYKILFALDDKYIPDLAKLLDSLPHDGVDYLHSNKHYYEIVATGQSKGVALKRWAEIEKIDIKNVIAIGDFYNDKTMLEEAGYAVVPDNAPDDLKALSDLIVCDCKDGAVGDLIEYIEKHCEV